MSEHVQAFDFYRDDQGLLSLALYDPKKDILKTLTLSEDSSRCFLVGGPSITDEVIAFLEEYWGDKPPEILEADSALRWVGVEQYLISKGVALKIAPPHSGCTGVRGTLEGKLWRLTQRRKNLRAFVKPL